MGQVPRTTGIASTVGREQSRLIADPIPKGGDDD